jgi:hypothetical protein
MVLSCLLNYTLEMMSIELFVKICHVLYNILKTDKQKATNRDMGR